VVAQNEALLNGDALKLKPVSNLAEVRV